MDASSRVYEVMDTTFLHRSVSPSRSIGALFAVECLCFVTFVVCFALRLEGQFVPQDSIASKAAITNGFGLNPLPQTIDDLIMLLIEAPNFVAKVNSDKKTTNVLLSHRLLGGIVIIQQRSKKETCELGTLAFACAGKDIESSFQEFSSPLDQVAFDKVNPSECMSLWCHPSQRSPVSWNYYGDVGVMLRIFNGSLFANATQKLQEDERSKICEAFIEQFTRFVSLRLVLVNGNGNLLTYFVANFEIPVAGGVFPWIESSTILLGEARSTAAYTVIIWVYTSTFLLLTIVRTVIGIARRSECQPCRSRHLGATLAANCLRCNKPVSLDMDVPTKCSFCGTVLQPPPHSCWRTQLDPTRIVAIANIVLIACAIALESEARNQLENHLKQFLNEDSSISINISAEMDQIKTVSQVNAFNILVAFFCLYRFMGRVPWISRFLKVISSGGAMMGFFFLGFSAVFTGFMLSFHLMLGESMIQFATFSGAFSSTFQLLLGLVDWGSVSAPLYERTFTAVYLFFCWLCILVMINVLISLVTAEYKRALKLKDFDLELESCRLLLGLHHQSAETEATHDEPALTSDEVSLETDAALPLVQSLKSNLEELVNSESGWIDRSKSVQNVATSLENITRCVATL